MSISFNRQVITAFNEMNTQESVNDYFVAGLQEGGEVTLHAKGKGGVAAVVQILTDNFASGTAVAVFRITAVDDRENTVSYRTKLVHVIYTGPKTPVMKRAKVGAYNAQFKQPFACNLHIQTDDAENDLSETVLQRALLASGGAHAPNRFDFTNCSAPGSGGEARTVSAPASPAASSSPAAARSPVAAAAAAVQEEEPEVAQEEEPEAEPEQEEEAAGASLDEVMAHHMDAFGAFDVDALAEDYTETSEIVLVNAGSKSTIVYRGVDEIKSFFEWVFSILEGRAATVLSSDNGEVNAKVEWEQAESGIAYASDTFVVLKGKIILQTLVVVDA